MLSETALKSMKVMLATPCYISAVSMHYVTSMFDLTAHAQRAGLDCSLFIQSESLITRARNKMVARFLEDGSLTHLFWIDSDLAFRPESALRLLTSGLDVVAGVYPPKSMHWPPEGLPAGTTRAAFEKRYTEFAFNPIGYGQTLIGETRTDDGFIEVAEAPTGFMAIRREVFLQMMAEYPDLNYRPDGPPNNPKARFYWLFFDCMHEPEFGRYLSEDFAFCRRWRDIGGKIHVDPSCSLAHLGQHLYAGNLEDTLKSAGRW
jgi:hypothetical protein